MRISSGLLVFFLIVSVFMTEAQESKYNPYRIGINRGGGFILVHSPTLAYLAQTHISKIELYGEIKSLGEKAWHQRYNYPSYGIALSNFDLNNDEYLGKAYSLLPYFRFNVWSPSENLLFRFRGGIGLGFIEKPFNPLENYKNIAIGSQLNVFFSFQLTTEYAVSKRTELVLGLNLSHFSNTAFQKPNLGINIPTLDLGLQRQFGTSREKKHWEEKPFEKPRGQWQVYLASGVNEVDQNSGVKYLATAFSIRREQKVNNKSNLGWGVDVFYNPGYRKGLAVDSIYIGKGLEEVQLGTSIHHILRFGRISNIVQLGIYFNNKDKQIGDFYQIVGGKYHFNDRWKGLIALKTHFAKAEYLMFGFEYAINRRDE